MGGVEAASAACCITRAHVGVVAALQGTRLAGQTWPLWCIRMAAGGRRAAGRGVPRLTRDAGTANETAPLVHGNWGVEYGSHEDFEAVFQIGHNRIRAGHAGESRAMARRATVTLLRRASGKGTTSTT